MVTRIIYRKTDITRKYPDIYLVGYNVNSYYKTGLNRSHRLINKVIRRNRRRIAHRAAAAPKSATC